MSRVFLFILDSASASAARRMPQNWRRGRQYALAISPITRNCNIPNLASLGAWPCGGSVLGTKSCSLTCARSKASWGFATEISHGKDTITGHWEIAGVPVAFDWGYFPNTIPAFPKSLTDELIRQAKLPGILGNKHASGTRDHRRTRRGTHAIGQADCLYKRRQCHPDRRA